MGTVLSRARLPPRSVLGAPHWGAAPEPAGERAPPNVHGVQPGALLALPKAENSCNPYCDTVENGSALGKSGTRDPQPDAKALLPTHTFPPCWNLRKSPKRPALPGAVTPGRCRSLAPTLSPALFSHPLFTAQCFSNVRCPQCSPNPSYEWRKIPFHIEDV